MSPSTLHSIHGQLTTVLWWYFTRDILSQRTRARYQRDANTRANLTVDRMGRRGKKEFRDFIAPSLSPASLTVAGVPTQSASFPFPRTYYIDRRERPRAEKTTTSSLSLSRQWFSILDLIVFFFATSRRRRIDFNRVLLIEYFLVRDGIYYLDNNYVVGITFILF